MLPQLHSRNVNAYHISNLIPYSISQINVTHMLSEFMKLEPIGPILNPTYFTSSFTATIGQLLQVTHSEPNSLAKEEWQLQKMACKPTNQYTHVWIIHAFKNTVVSFSIYLLLCDDKFCENKELIQDFQMMTLWILLQNRVTIHPGFFNTNS